MPFMSTSCYLKLAVVDLMPFEVTSIDIWPTRAIYVNLELTSLYLLVFYVTSSNIRPTSSSDVITVGLEPLPQAQLPACC